MRFVIALLIVLAPVDASAQPQLRPEASARPPSPLLDAARREGARLGSVRPSRTESAAQQAAPRRSWPARHPVLTGTIAGAGVGLGLLASQGCSSSDYSCPGLVTFFGGTGAGLGALGGAVAGLFIR